MGGAWNGGRAELDAFLAPRPLGLLLLAVAIAGRAARVRLAATAAALASATLAEVAFVAWLGAALPWAQALRGLSAGLALALAFDVAERIGRIAGGRIGPALGGVAALALLAVPGPLALYHRAALIPEPAAVADRRAVALVTGLPLLWDEGGPAATLGGSGNAAMRALARRFRFVPVEVDELARHDLALIVQPRPPGPAGLVAIDAWVREGGRLLLLVDPALHWRSGYPLGDPRRLPMDAGLAPLLRHWGVRLERGTAGLAVRSMTFGGAERRVALVAAGRLHGCGARGDVLATCRIGRGRVTILADADLLEDLAWVGDGHDGCARARRLADNPQAIGDLLDNVAGREPDRVDAVAWADAR